VPSTPRLQEQVVVWAAALVVWVVLVAMLPVAMLPAAVAAKLRLGTVQ